MIVFAFSCNILNDVHVNLIPFVFMVAVAAYYLPQNAGDLARKYIKDPDLLSFIDAECFIVSTVDACRTPMINASMVFPASQRAILKLSNFTRTMQA
jgi:hypothetical protein